MCRGGYLGTLLCHVRQDTLVQQDTRPLLSVLPVSWSVFAPCTKVHSRFYDHGKIVQNRCSDLEERDEIACVPTCDV
jgi:hypothetical protein